MKYEDEERIRLNERIGSITDRRILTALSKYRRLINTRSEIDRRGVRAFTRMSNKGLQFRAADEIELCHRWLDQRLPAIRSFPKQ